MDAGFDTVLRASPPAFTDDDAPDLGRRSFGVEAASAENLGSERDQTFLLRDAAGEPLAIMKVSNAAEDPATLDMEALAALHAGATDPELPVALPRLAPGADPADGPAAHRTALDAGGATHHDPDVRRPAGPEPVRRRRSGRRRLRRLGGDDRAARTGPAGLLPPERAADDALGRPARPRHPRLPRRRRRPAPPRPDRRGRSTASRRWSSRHGRGSARRWCTAT